MTRRAREVETLLLTMFAAVPLYFTAAIGKAPILVFHAIMAAIVIRVLLGKGPELFPAVLMRSLAVIYIPLYLVDWRVFSGSAIAASTHLVLFIAIYQPIESLQRNNQAQRALTTSLIFVASVATSTHITVMLFIVMFAFLMFRQLMYVSHLQTVHSIERPYSESPSAKTAAFYVGGAIVIGALLFPLLPRVRNPFVQGVTGPLGSSVTSLSESIDFNERREGVSDATTVARVWIDREARAFFAPIRLRGMIYDRYVNGEWRQTRRGLRQIRSPGGVATVARRRGVERQAIVQQRAQRGKIYLPVGTTTIAGLGARLYEGPARDTYYTYQEGPVNLTVTMAYEAEPINLTRVTTVSYPVTPEIAALAQRIVGDEVDTRRRAARIESYLSRTYRYLPNSAEATQKMSMDDFLFRVRAGHCEYFAAGMTVLLTALDIPARIAGGFYGGRLNPLTGYYTIRREDAHAWTEVWDGTRWVTYDSTPEALRPGTLAVNPLREYLAAVSDSLTFIWDRYILTFGLGDQIALAGEIIAWVRTTAAKVRMNLASDADDVTSLPFAAAIALLILAGAFVILFARRHRPLFEVIANHLAGHGIRVGPAMTLEEALEQLRREQPEAAEEIEPVVLMYEEERFSARQDKRRSAAIRRRLAELGA